MPSTLQHFTQPLLQWYDVHGRKNLPWQHPRDAYRVWLSEIMLQQTQVATVIPYFLRFIDRFPDIQSLAMAHEDEVMALWSGLGYYSRGRHLHQTASMIQHAYQGVFPQDIDILVKLPGIGPSTAAAIASQAFNQPTAILDGNVKRVLSRYFLIAGYSTTTTKTLWQRAQECMSRDRPADYTQAIMDLGATCCTAKKPTCEVCPLQSTCQASSNQVVADYPTKKPKKKRPVEHQQFIFMHNQANEIYLEKRHASGIWGSLWCPPSIQLEACPLVFVKDHYPLEAKQIRPLMKLKHTFTHFQLHIEALAIETRFLETSSLKLTGQWFSQKNMDELGMAKPIRNIVDRFYQQCL